MTECELCELNKAEYTMKIKNLKEALIFNPTKTCRVCKYCHDQYNPNGLERTELSKESIYDNTELFNIVSNRFATIFRSGKIDDKGNPINKPLMEQSMLDFAINDGLILHWRKIRRGN